MTPPDFALAVQSRWRALCRRLGVNEEHEKHWWATLEDAYAGPARHYHSLEHLAAMLALAAEHLDALDDARAGAKGASLPRRTSRGAKCNPRRASRGGPNAP